MCGIAGTIVWGHGRATAGIDLNRLVHRGPDDLTQLSSADFEYDTPGRDSSFHFALGHARLAIVDLTPSANQPMHSADNRYWLVFNGEIYNHEALRRELESIGRPFQTNHSDTEVVLQSLIAWGKDAVAKFNGMFAFVFIDRHEYKMIASRDRLGIKPLFFRWKEGIFEFASEISGLRGERELNKQALRNYFHFHQTPGNSTFYTGIHKLQASECIEWHGRGHPIVHQWWSPYGYVKHQRRPVDIHEIQALLEESIDLRMRADVEVGAYLSGGLDSSIIAAVASKKKKIKTFSFGFADGTSGYNSELPHAREVSRFIGSNHHEIKVSAGEYLETFDRVFRLMDEPIADAACGPLLLLSERAREVGVKVILGGEGADELFLGYRHWWDAHRVHRLARLIQKGLGNPGIAIMANVLGKRKPQWSAWLNRLRHGQFPVWGGIDAAILSDESELFQTDFLKATSAPYEEIKIRLDQLPEDADFFQSISYLDLTHRLPDQLLARIDRMSMAASIEARVPYLDHRLVEMMTHCDLTQLGNFSNQKIQLKQIACQYLPSKIVHRPKDGFTIPFQNIIKNSGFLLHDALKEVLSESTIHQIERGTIHGKNAWSIFALNRWMQHHF